MKLTNSLAATILLFLSTSISAKCLYSETDLKTFLETNSCEKCNLSGIDTYNKDHRNAKLAGANLSNASLFGDYTGADFSNTNGVKARFPFASGARFVNAVLIDANMSGENYTDADFTNANIRGVNFSRSNLYGAKISNSQISTASSVCDAILPDGSKGGC